MNTFEISITNALDSIARSLDMQVKQKERELKILEEIADRIGVIKS